MQKVNLLREGILDYNELLSFTKYLSDWANNDTGIKLSEDGRVGSFPQNRGMITVKHIPAEHPPTTYVTARFTDHFTIQLTLPHKHLILHECIITCSDNEISPSGIRDALVYIQCYVRGQLYQPETSFIPYHYLVQEALNEIDKFLKEEANPIKMMKKSSG